MGRLVVFGVLFLIFSVASAFVMLPEIVGGGFYEWIIQYWARIPKLSDRVELYAAGVSAAGLGLVSLSLWHAVSTADFQERSERKRWLRHMLEEWHSKEMNTARHRWYDEGRNRADHQDIASSLTADVFVIVNFFEKYARLQQASALDLDLTRKVFRDYAAWYWEHFFKEVLSDKIWDARMRAIDRTGFIMRFIEDVIEEKLEDPSLRKDSTSTIDALDSAIPDESP